MIALAPNSSALSTILFKVKSRAFWISSSYFEVLPPTTSLTPWYATMYVKKEFRGKGYSKILNEEILKEARRLGYKKVYLKSELINYYEKFGAKYIEDLDNGEKLYYIDL